MKHLAFFLLLIPFFAPAQTLMVKERKRSALTGSEFARSIADTTISLKEREQRIYREIKNGNIPEHLRTLAMITDTVTINGQPTAIQYFVLPDYLAIGSDQDYFYCPITPSMAQRIASMLGCSLPTRKISDQIYRAADIKMSPQPIPPSKSMVTVPVFIRHNEMIREERKTNWNTLRLGSLVAGNKKDVVISNKIYRNGDIRVVIYGWHKNDGRPVQPLYNGHSPDWADYSHGIRLVQNNVWVNGKRTTLQQVLQSKTLNILLSDEGQIKKPAYPTKQNPAY
ncbi:MAG TPA: hypothetical protein VGE26_03065 [Sphingobacteriaceae bacterium]